MDVLDEEKNYNSLEFKKFYEEFHITEKKSLLSELNEMTQIHDLDTNSEFAVNFYKSIILKNGIKVGDQNGKTILKFQEKNNTYLGFKIDNKIVSFVAGTKSSKFGKKLFIVNLSYTDLEYRQKGYVKQLYLWIKNNLKIAITNDKEQSNDAIKLYDNLSKDNNFNLKWYNTKTQEELPYNTPNIEFRNREEGGTDWLAIVEASKGWKRGSEKNPYGHHNWKLYTHFEEDPLSEQQYLDYGNLQYIGTDDE